MNISVAMAAYNGARFLEEQLRSIAAQDCPPDEMVVSDDGSSDDTTAILDRFRASAPFEVRIYRNARNVGPTRNFAEAIGLCTGEWIALADQDDVWLPHKLRRLGEAVAERPDAGLVFSDAQVVDLEGQPLGHTLWEAVGFTPRRQRRMAGRKVAGTRRVPSAEAESGAADGTRRVPATSGDPVGVLLQHDVVTGATMAFHAEYRDLVLPIPSHWVHDAWIALLIASVAPCVVIAEPLLLYRQHAAQLIGGRKRSFYQQYLSAKGQREDHFRSVAANHLAAYKRLLPWRSRLRSDATLVALRQKADHFCAKLRMRRRAWQRFPIIACEFARRHYSRYSWGWRSLVQDLFL
jgi:glycosyltransferase involved in cell wall biosynthesis